MQAALAPAGTSFLTEHGGVAPTGGLGWTPTVFWGASLTEFHAALRGRDPEAGRAPAITTADARRIARANGMTLFGEE